MFNNLVANLISNIRVTIKHKRNSGRAHYSRFCLAILYKLSERKIVTNIQVKMMEGRKYITFDMPNYNYSYLINHIFCFYSVSLYEYMGCKELKQLLQRYHDGVVSTNLGVFFIKDCIKKNIGGKLILLYR